MVPFGISVTNEQIYSVFLGDFRTEDCSAKAYRLSISHNIEKLRSNIDIKVLCSLINSLVIDRYKNTRENLKLHLHNTGVKSIFSASMLDPQ